MTLGGSGGIRISLFTGFSTFRETENFQKSSRESRNSRNYRENFPVIFLELNCFAFFFWFSAFQISFLAFCYVVLTNLVSIFSTN